MKNTKRIIPLGGHMSTAGGLEQAIMRGESIGCTAIGLFTKSNRQWNAKDLTQHEIELFINTMRQSPIQTVVAHACYLINLAASDEAIYQKSIVALSKEIRRCEQLQIPYLVLHPGSRGEQPTAIALQKIAKALNITMEEATGQTTLLLETMAGQGSSTCARFEELAAIRSLLKSPEKVGICVDTCHIFAAGYQLDSPAAYEETWQQLDKSVGLTNVKAFHLNDSMREYNSHVDRHANIGEGKIGLDFFRMFLNDPRFLFIPKIIETPKDDDSLKSDLQNLTVLKDLLNEANKALLK